MATKGKGKVAGKTIEKSAIDQEQLNAGKSESSNSWYDADFPESRGLFIILLKQVQGSLQSYLTVAEQVVLLAGCKLAKDAAAKRMNV